MPHGKQTFRYKFMRTVIMNDMKSFRAKHVKEWLRIVKPGEHVYDAQVHRNIIDPLLKEGFITKGEGCYLVVEEMLSSVEHLRRKKSGPIKGEKPKVYDVLFKLPEEVVETIEMETELDEHADDFDKYLAKKLKNKTREGE